MANPHVSPAFIAEPFKSVYVECRAAWQNDSATRQRIWDLFKTFDVDLAVSWEHVESTAYAILRLDPWRIELYDLLCSFVNGSATLCQPVNISQADVI